MVGFFGAFQDSKSMYIVMECCESGDLLEKLLSEGRAMAEKRVVNEVKQYSGKLQRPIRFLDLFFGTFTVSIQ